MSITNGYTTLALLKGEVGIPATTTTNDTRLEAAAAAASRQIDGHTGRAGTSVQLQQGLLKRRMDALRPERHLGEGLLHVDHDEGGFGGGGVGHGAAGGVKDDPMLTERTKRRKHRRRLQEDKKCQVLLSNNLG